MAYGKLNTGLIADIRQDVKDRIISDCNYVAVGTSNITPSASDDSLGNEILRKSRQEYTELQNSVIISGFFNSAEANSNILTEAGTFEESTGDNLKSKFLINPLEKTEDVELWIDNEIKLTIIQESG